MKTFFKLLKKELILNLGFGILAFVYIIFARLVTYIAEISNALYRYKMYPDDYSSAFIPRMINSTMSCENMFHIIVVISLGGLFALLMCRYLHNKKTVDFYHSLPVKKTTVFAAKYVTGIIYFAAAYTINYLFMLIATASMGYLTVSAAKYGFIALINGIFGYTMIYSFCVLAGLLTATVITHIVLASIFTYILPLVIALKEAWLGLFFVTYMYRADDWIANCSPVSYFFVKSTENHGSRYILVFIIVSLIVSAINFGVCKLRRSEATETALAFRELIAPLRIFFSIVCGACGAFILNEMFNKDGVSVFAISFIILTAVSSAVIQIIFRFDFGAVLKGKRYLAASVALSAALLLISFVSVKNYNTYAPKAEKIDNAAVYIAQLANDESYKKKADYNPDEPAYMDYDFNFTEREMSEGAYYEWAGAQDSILDHMTINDSDLAARFISACAGTYEGIMFSMPNEENNNTRPTDTQPTAEVVDDDFLKESDYDKNLVYDIVLKCRLKSGRIYYRSYRINFNENYDIINELTASEEYKKGFYNNLYNMDCSEIKCIGLDNSYNYHRNIYYNIDEDMTERLKTALSEDIKNLSLDEMTDTSPIVCINFHTAPWEANKYINLYSNTAVTEFVYPSFTNTIKVLGELGFKTYTVDELAEEISHIDISYNDWSGETTQRKDMTYTDKDKIKGILEYTTSSSLSRTINSGWSDPDTSLEIRIYSSDAYASDMEFFTGFPDRTKAMPDFLKKDLDI